MNRFLLRRIVPCACAVALAQLSFVPVVSAQQATTPLTSGIDRSTADPAVRIQDDAFRSVEGKWLAETPIPADRSSIGAFEKLYDRTQDQLRGLVEAAAGGTPDPDAAAEGRKIGDLYAGFMDEARIESLGLAPLAPTLAGIDRMRSKADVAAMIATLDQVGVDTPFSANVHQDAKDSSKYVVDLGQGGIGLPDRDYFLATGDQRFADIRAKYEAYLAKMSSMIERGDRRENPAAQAKAVIALEHAIAEAQWTRVQNRDPVKTYNVVALADLPKLAPHLDWKRYLATAGIAGRTGSVVVSQPTYLHGLDQLVARVPLATWKAYLKMRVMAAYAPFLGHDFVDTRFAFFGTTVRGTPREPAALEARRAAGRVVVGREPRTLYVAKYFPPESKARMDALVGNLLAAYKGSIDGLDWMGPETKKEAQAKLATFMPKIGYPVRWRDYASLAIARDDVVGNVMRAKTFEYRRNIAKLGRPIDRDEWGMTPQTINAYYNPELNEIVFPAAILQPPFFDPKADDAANYGAIGAVIGHEISHGFDDQGSQYDGARQPARLVDGRGPSPLRREDAGVDRAIRRVRAGARVPHQRRADAGREHRGQLGPRDRVQGVSTVAARPAGAGDRRADRRPALLHGLHAGVAGEDARGVADRAAEGRSALARRVPRERHADESARLLRRLRREAGRPDVHRAGEARDHLVTGRSREGGRRVAQARASGQRPGVQACAGMTIEGRFTRSCRPPRRRPATRRRSWPTPAASTRTRPCSRPRRPSRDAG